MLLVSGFIWQCTGLKGTMSMSYWRFCKSATVCLFSQVKFGVPHGSILGPFHIFCWGYAYIASFFPRSYLSMSMCQCKSLDAILTLKHIAPSFSPCAFILVLVETLSFTLVPPWGQNILHLKEGRWAQLCFHSDEPSGFYWSCDLSFCEIFWLRTDFVLSSLSLRVEKDSVSSWKFKMLEKRPLNDLRRWRMTLSRDSFWLELCWRIVDANWVIRSLKDKFQVDDKLWWK